MHFLTLAILGLLKKISFYPLLQSDYPGGTYFSMNFDYRLSNNHRCLWHAQCSSGYCKNGGCHDPEKTHDPCRPELKNCPNSLLQCSESSRTCVPLGYKPFKTCITVSDCKFNESCIKGTCRANIPIGDKCETINPDLCVMGSKCTVALSNTESTKCYKLCNSQIACPSGYKCTENIWNADPICIEDQPTVKAYSVNSNEIVQAIVIVLAVIIVFLGIIYSWIRFTRSGRDPRLKRSSKKKKKRVRLNYEGNGLATITVIPSNCQSPLPVAASQLFNVPINEPPPAYSEVINIQ